MAESDLNSEFVKVCRTCLEEIDDDSNFSSLEPVDSSITSIVTLSQKLTSMLPQINLRSTPNPVVCSDCSSIIDLDYHFKKRCLLIEDYIHGISQKLDKANDTIDLSHVAQYGKQKQQNQCNNIKLELDVAEESILEQLDDAVTAEVDTKIFSITENLQIKEEILEAVTDVDLKESDKNTDYFETGEVADSEMVTDDNNLERSIEEDPLYILSDDNKVQKNEETAGNNEVKSSKEGEMAAGITNHQLIDTLNHNVEQTISPIKAQQTKPYKCNRCDFSTLHRSSLYDHWKIHKGIKPFKCSKCEYATSKKDSLIRHKATHMTRKLYTCDLCHFTTVRKDYLPRHRQTMHTGEKLLQCPKCDYKCCKTTSLKHHLDKHADSKPFQCHTCDYETVYKSAIISHLKTHSQYKPYKCGLCSYRCSSKQSLGSHINYHTGHKPYKCTYCEYRCTQSSHLKAHVRTHTKEKPYKCAECKYSTTQSSHLIVHMRRHTGEKPYSCGFCNYKASIKYYLDIHIRTHTQDKPYKCLECDYCCTQGSSLRRHVMSKH